MTSALPRRFRFSLRTLFVTVTLVGSALGWVQYQRNWIRQRDAVLTRGEVRCFQRCTPLDPNNPYDVAPWSLRIFGAAPAAAEAFYLPDNADDKDVARIQSLFPETRVRRLGDMLNEIEVQPLSEDTLED